MKNFNYFKIIIPTVGLSFMSIQAFDFYKTKTIREMELKAQLERQLAQRTITTTTEVKEPSYEIGGTGLLQKLPIGLSFKREGQTQTTSTVEPFIEKNSSTPINNSFIDINKVEDYNNIIFKSWNINIFKDIENFIINNSMSFYFYYPLELFKNFINSEFTFNKFINEDINRIINEDINRIIKIVSSGPSNLIEKIISSNICNFISTWYFTGIISIFMNYSFIQWLSKYQYVQELWNKLIFRLKESKLNNSFNQKIFNKVKNLFFNNLFWLFFCFSSSFITLYAIIFSIWTTHIYIDIASILEFEGSDILMNKSLIFKSKYLTLPVWLVLYIFNSNYLFDLFWTKIEEMSSISWLMWHILINWIFISFLILVFIYLLSWFIYFVCKKYKLITEDSKIWLIISIITGSLLLILLFYMRFLFFNIIHNLLLTL